MTTLSCILQQSVCMFFLFLNNNTKNTFFTKMLQFIFVKFRSALLVIKLWFRFKIDIFATYLGVCTYFLFILFESYTMA